MDYGWWATPYSLANLWLPLRWADCESPMTSWVARCEDKLVTMI
jgi:hypothetical protein